MKLIRCECGCLRDAHIWEYANNVIKIEECKNCSCKKFKLECSKKGEKR